jgi:hypothetical protein
MTINKESRYDFLNLLGLTKVFLKKSSQVSGLYQHLKSLNLNVDITSNFVDINDNEALFFRSRLKYKFQNSDQYSEYVVIPSYSNPRWIIKNNKLSIERHGMMIKPSSVVSKLVWRMSKIFNKYDKFNIVFQDRFIVKYNTIEFNLLGASNYQVDIIYTGAPGMFQKFTYKLYNLSINKTFYLKLGIQIHSIDRINQEIENLNYLGNFSFDNVDIPDVVNAIHDDKYVAFIQTDILNNRLGLDGYTTCDFHFISELYKNTGISTSTINHLSNTETISEFLGGKVVYLGYSHGDYIPWNRFIDGDIVKVIDWETAGHRILFYDLFTIIIISSVRLNNIDLSIVYSQCIVCARRLMKQPALQNIFLSKEEIQLYFYISICQLVDHYNESALDGGDSLTSLLNKLKCISFKNIDISNG